MYYRYTDPLTHASVAGKAKWIRCSYGDVAGDELFWGMVKENAIEIKEEKPATDKQRKQRAAADALRRLHGAKSNIKWLAYNFTTSQHGNREMTGQHRAIDRALFEAVDRVNHALNMVTIYMKEQARKNK